MTNPINPKKILESQRIKLVALNKKKLMLLQGLDFSDRHGTKSEFKSKLSLDDHELLKVAVNERIRSQRGEDPVLHSDITQSELQKMYIEYWDQLKKDSINNANKISITVLQGGAPGLKK